ncbi:hypothetical protein FEM48_Zijuj10G0004600 [Ziziphus jujuba var. spinosa]|uniref:DUF659 domain-containing protein n=1 Tax=Ziziphus jujuba var. spinosa TaxID=714518 RepID=A0A978UK75_ZIZJJ|nr:hypothetical protein FEM48_Zijuj10G0004600 [Ziziphus jujuba var. spinosa]
MDGINVRDHGKTLDGKRSKVQCNYCAKVMSGFFRLKCHLGGIRGDVTPCEKAPANVKELLRNRLLERKRENIGKEVGKLCHPDLPLKRNSSPNSTSVSHNKRQNTRSFITEGVTIPSGSKDSQTASNDETKEDSASRKVLRCIGRFFYETGLDFSAVNSVSFKGIINATLDLSQVEYEAPSCQELKGWILQAEVKEMQEYVKNIRKSWATTGCSILLDGWVDEKGRHLVSFLVDCPQGPMYLNSYDISPFMGNIEALQLLLEQIIEELGVENVIQVVAYSTTGWLEALGKQFMDRCKGVFWTVSSSHCIEIMLEKIGMIDTIRETLDKIKIITKFIHSHATVLKLWKKHAHGDDIIKPSKIRSAMPFMTLEYIVSAKQKLEDMFASPEWNMSVWASRVEGKRVANLVGNHSFWVEAEIVSKATIPLVRLLIAFGLLCCIVRMVKNQKSQDLISQQLDEYRNAKGCFQEGSAIGPRTTISPANWWSSYGQHHPELQKFAVRILSQNCDGASKYGLKRTMAEKLLTNGRNPIEQQRLSDLTFVHYNLQLQQFKSPMKSDILAEEVDPMDDWIVDEAPESVCLTGDSSWMGLDSAEADIDQRGPSRFEAKKEPR